MQMSPKPTLLLQTHTHMHGHAPARTHTLYLWMGSLKGKKDQVQISRAGISNGAVVSKEGGGRGIIMSILMQNREVKGYYQLFIEGAKTSGDPWDYPMTCKSWKIPEREDVCKNKINFFQAEGKKREVKHRKLNVLVLPTHERASLVFTKGHQLQHKCATVT